MALSFTSNAPIGALVNFTHCRLLISSYWIFVGIISLRHEYKIDVTVISIFNIIKNPLLNLAFEHIVDLLLQYIKKHK